MKRIIVMFALVVNFLVGGTIASYAGISPIVGGIVMNGIAMLSPLFGCEYSLKSGIYTEVWTGEMIKAFRTSMESIGWLNRIRSYDQYAENDVIHFVHIGGDPSVLINNNTYPIAVETLDDADKAISLDKYQTKATVITDDELYAISYDKMASVIERHKEAMLEKKYSKALHALAPGADSNATPVILTSGARTADGKRKTILRTDIIKLKKKFDTAKIPLSGRILVLCPDHVNDLLENDQKFAEQYYNYTTGKISNMYGFELYEYVDCPYYRRTGSGPYTYPKLAFGATITAADSQASVAFYAPRMMKATGSTTAYLSEAKTDPLNQQNLLNYRHYFICLPLKDEAIGAIVSEL
ncbi:MAG: hypothetical protein LBG80_04655 [Bacteroidales bacterium]|jgi:hypothetical protein|nr:hypothetical protein [Bacteroidales bacterium]